MTGDDNFPVVIPAIHDWHLEEVLGDLGLLDAVRSGTVQCAACGRPVTLMNLSAIRVGPQKTYEVACDDFECLGTFSKG